MSELDCRVPGRLLNTAAALVPAYMDIGVGDRIVDFCAAPGGKTMALAA